MHEVNISPLLLSLSRFFLTQKLGNLERQLNVNLDIFVSGASISRNLPLHGFEKEHFSYIRTHTHFFASDFSICVAQNQGMFDD